MEDLIFSTLVGIMTTVGMSLVIYQPKPKAVTTTRKTVTVAPSIVTTAVDEEVKADLWDTESEEISTAIAIDEPVETIDETITEIEATEVVEPITIDEPVETIKADETAEIDKPIAEIETAETAETIEPNTLILVNNNEIKIDNLPVGICKKIAGKLTKQYPDMKISQTVNKISKPVSQLRSEIKNRIAKEPSLVMAIIEDVLASESNTEKPGTKKPAKTRNLKAVS